LAPERVKGAGFILLNIKNSIELRHAKQVVNVLARIYDFELATVIADGCMASYELA
jgi:hypothetical protein